MNDKLMIIESETDPMYEVMFDDESDEMIELLITEEIDDSLFYDEID